MFLGWEKVMTFLQHKQFINRSIYGCKTFSTTLDLSLKQNKTFISFLTQMTRSVGPQTVRKWKFEIFDMKSRLDVGGKLTGDISLLMDI